MRVPLNREQRLLRAEWVLIKNKRQQPTSISGHDKKKATQENGNVNNRILSKTAGCKTETIKYSQEH